MAKKKKVDPALDRITKDLGERLEKLLKERGLSPTDPADKAARSALRNELVGSKGSLIPEGYNLEGINAFFRGQKTKLKLEPSKAGSQEIPRRVLDEMKPGDEKRAIKIDKDEKSIKRHKLRTDLTQKFKDTVSDLGYDDVQINEYIDQINTKNRALANERTRLNRTLPEGSKQSIGHLHPVSQTIDSPSNRVLEPLTINVQKGDSYSLSRAGQMAIGNVANPDLGNIDNWKNDFLVWADKPENGGSGALPQRGSYSDLMEQKLSEMSGIQYDKLDDASKVKAIEDIDEFVGGLEKRNPWTVGEQAQQKKWGILSESSAQQAQEWMSELDTDKKINKTRIPDITKIGGKFRTADSLAQIASGNVIGGGAGLIMQHPAFHKQIGKALGKTLAKSGAKLIPGVGMTMGTLEAAGYAKQGRLTQAGIAGFSALVGEIPMVGDFLSAGADLVNTGIDIATGNMGKVEMEMDDVKEFDGVPIRAARRLAKAA